MPGYPGTPPPQPAPTPRQPRRVDLPIPKQVGKRYEDWTEKEIQDANLWALGPRFRAGLTAPKDPSYDVPSIPGSSSDVQFSHMGTGAGEVWE